MKKLVGLCFGLIFKTWYKIRYKNNVQIGKGFICNWRFKIRGKGRVVIGDDCNFWAHDRATQIYTYSSKALVKIGDNCRLNGAILMARESIQVGSFVLCGSANILDNDFHSLNYMERRKDLKGKGGGDVSFKPVVIGDDVWIAGEVVVLKGVEVGDRAVLGTRAVVTKNVEAETVVAGNPARPVKGNRVNR